MNNNGIDKQAGIKTAIGIFIWVTACIGLGMGLSDGVLGNYFKEAYDVTPYERGVIEFPRELPGILSMFAISGLAFLGNIRTNILAMLLSAAALVALGLFRPDFSGMLLLLFILMMGTHMNIPIADSIGLSLAQKDNMGRTLGRFNSARMASFMIAGILTFFGFRFGFFSFDTPVAVFLLAAAAFLAGGVLLVILYRVLKEDDDSAAQNSKMVLRKEYTRYYIICALFGGRKQIMIVYSPWVLIDLLGFRADVISILAVAGSFIGIFFMPVVGRWVDRYGVKRVMIIEALAFIAVYIAYGFLSGWVNSRLIAAGGALDYIALGGVMMILVYLLNIADRMSAQFGMVRAIYMKSIAIKPGDVTPSLSMGMAIDHVLAIAGSFVCGIIWYNWGPQYVFVVAGMMSLGHLIAARGIKLDTTKPQGEA
ncbi:MAG: MFS transporter [Oscillospiraceae bacterium]|nr:MFS transporter [Oscillospiraceae bacterium]